LNPLRDRRLYEVRRRLHSKNLDIGSGWVPITPDSVTVDIEPEKSPDFCIDVLKGLPFEDGSFDSVTCLEMLEHFKGLDQLAILSEICRVLHEGGELVVSIPYSWGPMRWAQRIVWFVRARTSQKEYYRNGHVHGHIGLIDPGELGAMLIWSGFEVVEARRILLYDYLVVARKSFGN